MPSSRTDHMRSAAFGKGVLPRALSEVAGALDRTMP
jgi:hypothetical protein